MTDGQEPARTRREIESLAAQQELEQEVEELLVAQRRYVFHPEPRCRVCQHEEITLKVNALLAKGRSYAAIVRDIGSTVKRLGIAAAEQPTYQSVRNHAKRHFAVDDSARALHREILERRAMQSEVDFVTGMAHAITPLALLETTMVKGYQHLIKSETEVDLKTAMDAAMKLQQISAADESTLEATELMAQLNHVIEAVRAVVPEQYWQLIVDRLDGKMSGVPLVRDAAPIEAEIVEDEPEPEDPAYEPDAVALDDEDELE